MEKSVCFLEKFLRKFSKVFVIILFISVLLFSLIFSAHYNYNDSPYFGRTNSYTFISIALNIAVILLMLYISRKTKINFKILSILYFTLEIVYMIVVPLKTFSDMKFVSDIAMNNFHDDTGYLLGFSNNYPIVIIFYILFKAFYSDVIVIRLINIFMNIGIAYFSYKTYNLIYEKENKFVLLLSFINISVFLYVNHVYNDIMFTFLNSVLLYLVMLNKKSKVHYFGIILLSVLQYLIRPVGIIYIIAIAMYMFFTRKEYIKTLKYLVITFLIIIISNFIIVSIFGKSEENIGIWSFLQMGINEEEFGFQDGTHSSNWTSKDVINKAKALGVKRGKNKKIAIFNFIIIGFFLFYLIWEIKSRYIYSLYPIFIIYASRTVSYLLDNDKKYLKEKS